MFDRLDVYFRGTSYLRWRSIVRDEPCEGPELHRITSEAARFELWALTWNSNIQIKVINSLQNPLMFAPLHSPRVSSASYTRETFYNRTAKAQPLLLSYPWLGCGLSHRWISQERSFCLFLSATRFALHCFCCSSHFCGATNTGLLIKKQNSTFQKKRKHQCQFPFWRS